MKTIQLSIFAVLLFILSNTAVAQNVSTAANPKAKSDQVEKKSSGGQSGVSEGLGTYIQRNDIKGEKGSIFMGENWPLGLIVLKNGKIIDNYNLRYNLLADQMQFIAAKDTLAFASPGEIETVMFDGHTFVFQTYVCDQSLKQGYFEILEHGNNKLLLKRAVTYHLNNNDALAKNDFVIENCYFIAKGNKPAEKIACNKKKVLAVLDSHKPEIEVYLKKTGNKVKNETDLRQLVAYYNSLTE